MQRLEDRHAQPNDPSPRLALGECLTELGRVDRGLEELERALAACEAPAEASLRMRGDPDVRERVLIALCGAASQVCEWAQIERHLPELVRCTEVRLERGERALLAPFAAQALPVTPSLRARVAASWGEHHARTAPPPPPRRTAAVERLRVGYLSPDFSLHAVGFLLGPLLSFHDREQVEAFAYDIRQRPEDEQTRAIAASVDHFVPLSHETHTEAAARIAADGIHVLVDLAGYTQASRLGILAQEPAPVQAHWLGYPGTLGAPFVRYFLHHERWYGDLETASLLSEVPVLLPDAGYASCGFEVPEEVPSRAELGLPAL